MNSTKRNYQSGDDENRKCPKLTHADVLDVFSHDENNEQDSDSESDGSFESDVPDDKIVAMLEQGLSEESKGKRQQLNVEDENDQEGNSCLTMEKFILEDIAYNHFDMLPDGWIQIRHYSGMPVYLHRKSRVCTLSKPYFLGPGSARKHDVPLSAVPCLQYRHALDAKANPPPTSCPVQHTQPEDLREEQTDTAEIGQTSGKTVLDSPKVYRSVQGVTESNNPPARPLADPVVMSASIETYEENKATQSLNYLQFREYCEKLFHFRKIKVTQFKTWSDRKKFMNKKKHMQRPTLPEGTKLIKVPTPYEERGCPKGEWILNPNGKSYTCLLLQYLQHVMKNRPLYSIEENGSTATPFVATVVINDVEYGVGSGQSKKQAKSEAAKATLEMLIPQMKEKIEADEWDGSRIKLKGLHADSLIFDEIKIEDDRVAELCAVAAEPSPYNILLTCLQRNFGLRETEIKYEGKSMGYQKNMVTMSAGPHTVTVISKSKQDGKQKASQAILQKLHPHITSWGSLLRLYGSTSMKSVNAKKQNEREIAFLQSKASPKSPNFALLAKLKKDMMRLHEGYPSKPLGKFIPLDDVNLPSASGAGLDNLDM